MFGGTISISEKQATVKKGSKMDKPNYENFVIEYEMQFFNDIIIYKKNVEYNTANKEECFVKEELYDYAQNHLHHMSKYGICRCIKIYKVLTLVDIYCIKY